MNNIIKISSKNRNIGIPGNFKINTPLIEGNYKLLSVFIANSSYNINEYNNKIYWSEDGGATTLQSQIVEGYYDIFKLVTALENALNNVSLNNYSVTYNSITNKLTISANVNFMLLFVNKFDSIGEIIGFESEINTNNNTSHTSQNFVNLDNVLSYNIDINGISNIIYDNFNSCSFIVPQNSPLGNYIYYEPINFNQVINFQKPTNLLHVRLFDDHNKIIDIHTDWYMVLQKI